MIIFLATGAFADFLLEFMSEANEDELIDDEILHQLEETLGKENLEKQLINHRQDSHPKSISPQISVVEDVRKTSVAQRKGSIVPGLKLNVIHCDVIGR